MPDSTFIERQVWMAVSLKLCWRLRLPIGAASEVLSGSNRIVSELRGFSAS